MSLAHQLEAAAQGVPAPHGTPVLQVPVHHPPPLAPLRRSNHANRASVVPRKLETDQWLNDCTSGISLGRVLEVKALHSGGRVIKTTRCTVRVSPNLVVSRGCLDRLSLHGHHVQVDMDPVE